MRTRNDLSSGWAAWELVYRDASGDYTVTPFSDTLANGSDQLAALNRMSMVDEMGWPKAMQLKIGKRKGKRRIVKKDEHIYLLKCTPKCWRLYFYVRKRQFIYVHAVCKKGDAEDPSDGRIARECYDGRARCQIQPFVYPSN